MDLALNNLQRLICHKTHKPTNQPYKKKQKKQIANIKKIIKTAEDNVVYDKFGQFMTTQYLIEYPLASEEVPVAEWLKCWTVGLK